MLETKPPNIRVTTLKGQWTEERAQRTVRSWLNLATSRRAEFNLVAAQDDSMAMGARKAFEEISEKGERDAWLSLPSRDALWASRSQPIAVSHFSSLSWPSVLVYISS
jgi:ribose transport system substrate-binding protein